MGNLCAGRVAIVTGAGRGLGREYALMLAEQGAKVVVNDLGATAAGEGADLTPAQSVVEAIRNAGGEAIADRRGGRDFWAPRRPDQQCRYSAGPHDGQHDGA
ncbi:SDR family NAD(P)-dependent oxidoreductase [Bradyrhizobium sp. AUGA SZCCT0160]|uniref:SDR family NAD(P)-dependent oxidoreductase n=1 Tax=Bradyrhizobium sp. AUGA SZCCT0160 TaxID=2807662 RepID=UPI001BA6FD58|nr:SDR family NAD(P)-dependent oxidoreductase [Bradyrhizobium sp. AUGA SZCCT0160]